MLTDALCTRCGLCCDGTFFGDVELTGHREATRLAQLGLDVDSDDADIELLALPCAGLRGRRCGVYPDRPQCCRTFECRLLQEATQGEVTADVALERILVAHGQVARVQRLLAPLEGRGRTRLPLAERVAEALASDSRTPAARRGRTELARAMTALTRTIRSTFLD